MAEFEVMVVLSAHGEQELAVKLVAYVASIGGEIRFPSRYINGDEHERWMNVEVLLPHSASDASIRKLRSFNQSSRVRVYIFVMAPSWRAQ